MCSVQRLSARACLWLRALSLMSRFCFHMVWRSNLPGRMGIRSLTGLPKTHIAGDIRVAGSGVFRYCRIALWKASESRLPLAVTLPVSRRFIVFTPTSALQLLWGNATELRRWWTPQSWRNCVVVVDVNSGPPSVASSSGMPNVEKMRLSALTTPLAPSSACFTMGQFE